MTITALTKIIRHLADWWTHLNWLPSKALNIYGLKPGGPNKPFWFWPFLILKSGLWPFLIWPFEKILWNLANFCGLWPFLAKKVGNWPFLENKSGQKNWQKLGKNGWFWAIFGLFDPFFVSKWAFLGKIVSLWPKTHFFSLINHEKKLKYYNSLRKKVGKWAEGEIRCNMVRFRVRDLNMLYNERMVLFYVYYWCNQNYFLY